MKAKGVYSGEFSDSKLESKHNLILQLLLLSLLLVLHASDKRVIYLATEALYLTSTV